MARDPQTHFAAAYDAYAEEYLKRVGETRSLGSVSGVCFQAPHTDVLTVDAALTS